MTETRTSYLSGGSNLGDRKVNLKNAVKDLGRAGIIVRQLSSVYETEPVDYLDQPWFLNIALEVEAHLPPQDLLACCREVETSHGRIRSFRGAPRALDLDILLFGTHIIAEPFLQIPHPRMAQRRFVLQPLAQIAPEVIHPGLNRSIRSLLASCSDTSRVTYHSELMD